MTNETPGLCHVTLFEVYFHDFEKDDFVQARSQIWLTSNAIRTIENETAYIII